MEQVLRDEDSRAHALKHIKEYSDAGERIVVVVSAMGRKGEPYATDTLVAFVKKMLATILIQGS